MRKLTTTEFIEKANRKHNYEYTYPRTVYNGAFEKVTVTCGSHGDWQVRPDAHARSGHGCPECKKLKISAANGHSTEQVVAAFKAVHGDKYDYTLVKHIKDHTKVLIVCPSHGEFECSPANHKSGRGCPSCTSHGYNIGKPGYIYILKSEKYVKIGITNNTVESRLAQINRTTDDRFEIVTTHFHEDGSVPQYIERQLLRKLRQMYQQPEQEFDGSTECFVNADVISVCEMIKNLNYQRQLPCFLSTPSP